jgi:hypothetical protein
MTAAGTACVPWAVISKVSCMATPRVSSCMCSSGFLAATGKCQGWLCGGTGAGMEMLAGQSVDLKHCSSQERKHVQHQLCSRLSCLLQQR